jgi:hypothetical protein
MTTTTAKATAAKKSRPVIELGADLSPAVAAIETAVRMFTKSFPDTPPITIVVKRDERAWGHTTVAKVWGSKKVSQATRFEIMISGENLRRGAEAVAATLLHELAHARNLSKGVLDTDVNGRHSRKFADVAEEHGLVITQDGWHGWTVTNWSPEGKARWARLIATIQRGLDRSAAAANADMTHMGIKPAKPAGKADPTKPGGVAVAPPKRGNRNLIKAVCGCGHSIRASQGVLDKAKPTCSECGQPFEPVGR